ncbi:MAG: metal ABC transporter permease [Deltaproteobacteria bacterium]|nr:metal ABC transporter permease [Deltaproteobacteria bacterium]
MTPLANLYDLFGPFYEPVFMKRAAWALLLLTVATSASGVIVVNRRMAFFPDAVGHSIFAGVALALILQTNIQLTVLALGLIIGLTIIFLVGRSHLAHDTVIGLVFSGAVALGLALVSRQPQATAGLSRFFLGDVLTVGDVQVLALMALAVISFLFLWAFTNKLTLNSIIRPISLKPDLSEYLFGAYLALVVVVSVQAVGVLLVTALLVAPAATGRVMAASFKGMFWASIISGILAGQIGLWASFQPEINTTTGATVVIVNVLFFALAVGYRRIVPVKG